MWLHVETNYYFWITKGLNQGDIQGMETIEFIHYSEVLLNHKVMYGKFVGNFLSKKSDPNQCIIASVEDRVVSLERYHQKLRNQP